MDRPSSPPDLSSALEKILANPELISMVASTLGAPPSAPPQKEEVASNDAPPEPKEETEDASASIPAGISERISSLAPLLSSLTGGKGKDGSHRGGKEDHRACLLRALKPYLNPSRQEAIDYMIRLSELSEVLKHLQ